MGQTQSEQRLARLIDERESTHQLHEGKLEELADATLNESDEKQIAVYRERMSDLDTSV